MVECTWQVFTSVHIPLERTQSLATSNLQGGWERQSTHVPRKKRRMDFGRPLAASASVFQLWPSMYILFASPRTNTLPFPRETTPKPYPVTTCSSKSSFSGVCSVFSIRSRYRYPLAPNIAWWSVDRITTMTHSEKGRMENVAVHRKHTRQKL